MRIRRKLIETKVLDLLGSNRIEGPPVPVNVIAERLGLVVKTQELDSDISGFLARDGRRPVIGVNGSQAPVRQRFTIAHEVGHYLLHRGDELHVDRGFRLQLRSSASSQGVDSEEIEANAFAAELLMPRGFIERDLQGVSVIDIDDEDFVRAFARRYQVSTQAFLLRLTNLGFINE